MAAAVLELGLSNLIVAAVLAVLALAAGRWGKRPALTHALWLLVLLKMVTPPVIDLPVRLLPAAPVALPPAPADAGQLRGTDAPPPPVNPVTLPDPARPGVADAGGARQALPPVFATRKVNELDTPPEPVAAVRAGATTAPAPATTSARPPAGVPLFPLGP
ncbi:MAG: High-affnity carbon uptake protein Hat/HatR, partial [Gemmataceae bacterium]|nr:High-affnity carbon uptake protein Hat/HatR [Gemmataceae bacterium]